MFDLDTTQNSSHEQSKPVLAEPSPDNGRQKKARGRSVAQTKTSARTGARETARARKSRRAPEAPVTVPVEPPAEDSAPEKPGKPPGKAASKRTGKSPRKAASGNPDEAADTAASDGKPAKSPPWIHEDPLGYILHKIQDDLGGAPEKLYETHGKPIRFRTGGGGQSGWVTVDSVRLGKGREAYFVQYGDWRSGKSLEWLSVKPSTPEEARILDRELRRLKEDRERDAQARHMAARNKAERLWRRAKAADASNLYLQRKGVQPHGARTWRWTGGEPGPLIIPLCDADREVWSIQFIQPDGGKIFLKGGRITGLFHPFGTHEEFERSDAILVCEGWATGATLREATGLPVAAAMNCGNLLPAARALKAKYPRQRLVICADDDWRTPGNPGLDKAHKAALEVGAVVVAPEWTGERGEKDTDFNDLALAEGPDAVRRLVDVGEIMSQPVRPGLDDRPCYWLLEKPEVIGEQEYRAGVYHCGIGHEKQFGKTVPVPTETWLSSPIRIEARTTEWPDGRQGVRLSVWDDRNWRSVILPRETLASSRYRELLFAAGAQLTPKPEPELVGYLQQDSAEREYVTLRTGWHNGQYVLPETTMGEGATISFTGLRPTEEPLAAGDLAGWQKSVAALAVGNPLLVLSISLAFVGPLLKPAGHNAVLVQLVGRSTTGKTTCLLAANSVVGPPALVTTWRATANGLEQKALAHCDGFLALDEIGQVEPRVLDHAVYALANGAVKQRATVYGHGVGAVPTQRWRVAALSTGEKTMEALLALDGRSVNAGQAVRFIEIPVEERYGAFTQLHGYQSAAALADALRSAVSRYYGTPLRKFLERLIDDDRDKLGAAAQEAADKLRKVIERNGTVVSAQSSRVLTSLALIATAGEMATRYDITGWKRGTAFDAARHCYQLWAQSRPTQTDFEQVDLLRRLRDFITRHGDSRFSPVAGEDVGEGSRPVYLNNPVVYERAGYYRDTSNGREYLFTSDGLREAVSGFDFRHARQELASKKVLVAGGSHDSQTVRIGSAKVRVYVVSFNALNRALEQIGGAE